MWALLTVACLLLARAAQAEEKYVSIEELRAAVPVRRTGKTVSIDTPIVVPEVDTVPVVRITWGGPYEGLNEAVEPNENSLNYLGYMRSFLGLDFDYNTDRYDMTVGDRVKWEDASDVFLEAIRRDVPAMKDRSRHDQGVIPTVDRTEGLYQVSYSYLG